jgi:hypothetical protein
VPISQKKLVLLKEFQVEIRRPVQEILNFIDSLGQGHPRIIEAVAKRFEDSPEVSKIRAMARSRVLSTDSNNRADVSFRQSTRTT